MASLTVPILVDMDKIRAYLEQNDIVEVVRCRECKHWNDEDHWCNIRDSYGWDYKPDDYCSYGERSTND